MKKLLALAAILVVVSVGCSDEQQNPVTSPKTERLTLTVSADTTIKVPRILTAPRYTCDGKQLNQPKLVGVDETSKNIHLTRQLNIDVDSMLHRPKDTITGIPVVKSDRRQSTSSGMHIPEWFKNLLWILLAILLIALLLWALYRLSRSTSRTPVSSTAAKDTDSVKPTTETRTKETISNRSSETSKIEATDYTGIKSVLEQIQKSQVGGTVSLGPLLIHVPSAVPDIHIVANDHSKVENITISIEANNVSADTMTNYAGDDNREYNRNTKKEV